MWTLGWIIGSDPFIGPITSGSDREIYIYTTVTVNSPLPSLGNIPTKGSRVLAPRLRLRSAMALSSSTALRRLLRSSSSSIGQLRWPFSADRRSFSFLSDDDTSTNNLPPLTTPKLFVSG